VGLDEDDMETLKLGGLFHDVGKIGTADDILLKDTQLSQDEFDEIKRHTVTGANILSVITMFKTVVPLVRHHHEHFNGRGYPDGLAGEDIPYLARILSVADAYDAMMSNRVYRNKLGAGQIVEELLRGRGTQFDSKLVDAFVQLIDTFIPPHQNVLKDFFSYY
jgi:putative nucleotidyltransferase with HDIG domain